MGSPALRLQLLVAIVAGLLLSGPGAAQQPDESSVPTTSVPGATSPRIHADGRVTFTLRAPEARSLQLEGGDGLGKGPFPMTKDADGTWNVTIAPPVPGFHYYWFVLDGVQVNDPASETFFGYGRETSGIEIPEPGASSYALTAVPHGAVREHWYFSKTTGEWRRARIYTPPGYDKDKTRRYPVLILQHGSGEDETGWTRQGRAQWILDNLIASGRARPMIVVMDRGYARRPGMPDFALGPATTNGELEGAYGAFEDVVIHDLIPAIDAAYRTIPDREHRALAGLSMGGMQALRIGLHHLDEFAWIATLSGPFMRHADPAAQVMTSMLGPFDTRTAYDGAFADPAKLNAHLKLLWIGVGTAEPDLFHQSIGGAVETLRQSGIRLTSFESQGTAHEWQTWRRDLEDLAPRLFQ
jgi:enterochelin esterase family protein